MITDARISELKALLRRRASTKPDKQTRLTFQLADRLRVTDECLRILATEAKCVAALPDMMMKMENKLRTEGKLR